MSVYNSNNNKFVSYLIILFSLFILVLFTKEEIKAVYENKDLKETKTIVLEEKKAKLKELNDLKINLASSQENIDKYIVEINEDEIIDYIYSYIEKISDSNGVIFIKNVTISEPKETELGFNETVINLNLGMPNLGKLVKLLEYLTSEKSKYKFYISSLDFPYGDADNNFNMTIPLKILHK